jgi:uncharacterized membrane protein
VKIRISRALSLAGYLGLIALVMAWIVFLGEVGRQYISLSLILFVTPLLLPLRGVLAGRDKALVWGTLLVLPYMVHGGMVAWAGEADRWLGVTEGLLGLLYLLSASFFIRWRAELDAAGEADARAGT